MALVFVPPSGTENVLNYEVNLIGQAAILIGDRHVALYFTHADEAQITVTERPRDCADQDPGVDLHRLS